MMTPFDPAKPVYSRSLAAIIGINRYGEKAKPPLSDLNYARQDAEAFAEVLEARFGFRDSDLLTLFDEDATEGNIRRLLADRLPAEAGPDARVIIFFSGHGRTEKDFLGRDLGYLVPYDFDADAPVGSAISMTQGEACEFRGSEYGLFLER